MTASSPQETQPPQEAGTWTTPAECGGCVLKHPLYRLRADHLQQRAPHLLGHRARLLRRLHQLFHQRLHRLLPRGGGERGGVPGGLVPRGKPQPTGGRMCADMCTGTTCSQTRFGHCAPDGRGIRTPCFRGSPAWAGRARPCRAAREAGGTHGLAETGSASAAGGVVVVLWRDADCGTPPRGRRT